MTLGQRISQHRKRLGLSQEALGECLGVSRQAVSKWETGAATPDMENLLTLARIFQVSVAELTETPEEKNAGSPSTFEEAFPSPHCFLSTFWPVVCGILAVLLIGTLALTAWLNSPTVDPAEKPVETPPLEMIPDTSNTETTVPIPAPQTDFALLWYGTDGKEEFLELGEQDAFFPFGTSLELTEPEKILDTDFEIMTTHHADCGNIVIDFYHIEEDLELDPDSPERDSVWSLSTMVSQVRTPRGVHVGSTKAQVLDAYGDDLIYCMKEEGGYSLVRHDYYYAFQTPETFGASLQLFMLDGIVAGIRVEHMAELGNTAFAPDHISRFPLVNGEPDYSQRTEPEQEYMDDTRKVYIAFNQLVTNNNLSAEELYAYRRDVFSLLPYMDWQEFGSYGFGGTTGPTVEQFSTIEALMSWLQEQQPYSEAEIFRLQMGSTAKGLDGAYADMYAHLLSAALFQDPISFIKGLAYDGLEQTMSQAVLFTAYDAIWYESDCYQAVVTLEKALSDRSFTDTQTGWCNLLLLYLTTETEDGTFGGLPKTPAELPIT